MSIDPSTVSNFILIATAFTAAFLAALWLSLLVWTSRDIRRRARDPLARILAVLVVAVLFLPGILIYLILRPTHTLEEEYQSTLEEEALLQSIEDSTSCPGCGKRVQTDWILCPHCHNELQKKCEACSKKLDLTWDICPYCGKKETPAIDPGISLETSQPVFPAEPID